MPYSMWVTSWWLSFCSPPTSSPSRISSVRKSRAGNRVALYFLGIHNELSSSSVCSRAHKCSNKGGHVCCAPQPDDLATSGETPLTPLLRPDARLFVKPKQIVPSYFNWGHPKIPSVQRVQLWGLANILNRTLQNNTQGVRWKPWQASKDCSSNQNKEKSPTKIGSKLVGVEITANSRISAVFRTFEAVDGLKSSNL